jgi:Pyridoxamine 5'-phosphate oxidase
MAIRHRNLDGYDNPPIEWDRVRQTMAVELPQAPGTDGPGRHTAWLTTTDSHGMPHVRPVGIVRHDGKWYFNAGPHTVKARNVAKDARCVVALATEPFDLVVEGTASRVTDADELAAVCAAYVDQGWPAEVEGDALTAEFSAPSAGKPPYHVHRVDPSRVYAFGTAEPFGATRFDL